MRQFLARTTAGLVIGAGALALTPRATAQAPAADIDHSEPLATPAAATPPGETAPAAPVKSSAALDVPQLNGPPAEAFAPILDNDSRRFSFQARLTTPAGDPLPGPSVNLAFQLYDEGGFALGAPVALNGVAVMDGVVDVLVPFTPADFDGQARAIGVRVNGGAEMNPRLELGAVPYAYRVDRVASAELDDAIELGAPGQAGYLSVFGGGNFPTFVVEAAMRSVALLNDNNSFALQMFSNANSGFVGVHNAGNLNAYMSGAAGEIWSDSTVNVGVVNNNLANTLHAQLRTDSTGGQLRTFDEAGVSTVRLGSSAGSIGVPGVGGFASIYNEDGWVTVFVDGDDGSDAGLLQVRDTENDTAIEINATERRISGYDSSGNENLQIRSNAFGGAFTFRDEAGNITMGGGTSAASGGYLSMYRGDGAGLGVFLDGDSLGAGLINAYNASGNVTVDIDAQDSGNAASIELRDGNTTIVALDAGANIISLHDNSGAETVRLNGEAGEGGGGANFWNSAGVATIEIDADESDAPAIRLFGSNGAVTMTLDGEENGGGSALLMRNSLGNNTIELDADEGDDAIMRLRRADGSLGVVMNSDEGGNGADINLYNGAGQVAIQIDTNWSGGANSRIVVDELQIAGGSDLSEQFDVSDVNGVVEPGMVVSIDPANPGKLVVSTQAYDRTVAGIVSGANGVKTGMYMGQKGSLADGQLPIALTGRVYCYVDASQGAIEPGDLLTTSATPGHAMKVTDHGQSQGAIIGKAMTGLKDGRGLVLVLVSLQ